MAVSRKRPSTRMSRVTTGAVRNAPIQQPTHRFTQNRLLAKLPAAARVALLARGELVDLWPATILCEPGVLISHVFFPVDSYVALMAGTSGRAELEAGLVGNEGVLGVTVMLGVRHSPLQWLVQGAGRAWRVEAGQFLNEIAASPVLRRTLGCYLYVAFVQLIQTATCKHFHVVEARLARWLLMIHDRTHRKVFRCTHENLAYIMGVRRAGITRAASALQKRRLIHYYRGDLQIVDRRGLEAASCRCYATDNKTYASVMG